jgi:hypothetical protein
MEYNQKICIERVEFHDLLASGNDCAMYLNFSLFFTTLLGFSFLGGIHYCLSLQNEIEGLVQVKKSLIDHIYTLEHELTAAYAEVQQEQEQEQEDEQEEEQEQGQEEEQEQEQEQDDLAEDTKPHAD